MRHERVALLVATGLVVILLARDGCRGKPPVDPAAPARTDAMIQALRDEGWTVMEAAVVSDLIKHAASLEQDTAKLHRALAKLAQEAFVAGAELHAVAELHAEAATALRLAGVEHGDTLRRLTRGDTAAYAGLLPPFMPDSITAEFDDGVFSGAVGFLPRENEFRLGIRARIAAALAIVEGADGRVLFSAVPSDERVTLSIQGASWQPPAPVQHCSLGTRIRWGLGGLAVGVAVPW